MIKILIILSNIFWRNIWKINIDGTLEIAEHNRRNNWNEYMLSLCSHQDGKYIIPAQRVKWWEDEIRTPYKNLSDKLKEYDKIEVYNIFSEIEKHKNKERTNYDMPNDDGR